MGNGDLYKGSWRDDKIEGAGKYYWVTGNIYEGNWVNNKRERQGKMT